MGFWDRMQNVDRRIIYTLLIVVITIALIRPVGLAIEVGASTKAVYDTVDRLPAGSIIWIGLEYAPSNIPELGPAVTCLIRQAFRKNLRIVGGGMWTEAGNLLEQIWTGTLKAEFPEKKYGVDIVNVGFKPGQRVYLEQLVTNVSQATLGIDHYGAKLDTLPLMKDFTSITKASLIFAAISGSPGEREYIATVTDPHKIPFAVASVSVSVPGMQPFVQSGQIIGLVPGLSGSAQYEVLVNKPGRAVAGLDAQSFAHALIVGFIVFGNLGYILSGRNKRASALK